MPEHKETIRCSQTAKDAFLIGGMIIAAMLAGFALMWHHAWPSSVDSSSGTVMVRKL